MKMMSSLRRTNSVAVAIDRVGRTDGRTASRPTRTGRTARTAGPGTQRCEIDPSVIQSTDTYRH